MTLRSRFRPPTGLFAGILCLALAFAACAPQEGSRAATLVSGAAGLEPWAGSSMECPVIDVILRGPPDDHGYGPASLASLPGQAAWVTCSWARVNHPEDAATIAASLAATEQLLAEPDLALDYLAEQKAGWCYLSTSLLAVRDHGWSLGPVIDECAEGLAG